jgi:heat shock protein HtpX
MKNQLKTVLLLGIMSCLLVGLGGALGPGYLYGFLALALVMNFVSYFFSDRIVLAMQRAREVSPAEAPELHQIVGELAQRAGVPKPRVYIIPEAQPNAFATGRNPEHSAVAVTEGILGILGERELRGVLAHEMAHVANRDILIASVAAAIAMAISAIARVVSFGAMFGGRSDDREGGSPLGGLLFAIVAPIAATLIQLAISRSREYHADETGARFAGNAEPLARALEKLEIGAERIPANVQPATASLFIVSPFAGRHGLLTLFSTHPPMEERIRRLRALRV